MIRITRAPAYATIQDEGRTGFRASGVPRAGAMDLPALRTLNAMLGNRPGFAAIEWALSAAEIQFEASATFSIGGASATITHESREIEMWRAHRAAKGDTVSISAPASGRFIYIAVAGGIDAPLVMNSRSTYLPGSLGGIDGRRLKSGDILPIGPVRRNSPHVSDALPLELRPPEKRQVVRYIPRASGLEQSAWTISAASDRTGYRLEGEAEISGGSITSQPVCPGVIQIPPEGSPIVLMSDAPTVGGYVVAGAVISADMGSLAQRGHGEEVFFEICTLESAHRVLDLEASRLARVEHWAMT